MTRRKAKLIGGASGLLLLASAALQAQTVQPRGIPIPRTITAGYPDRSRRDGQGDNVGAYRRLILAQIKKDFLKLQILNDALGQEIAANRTFDYKQIADTASKIKSLARRLDSNLNLGKAEKRIVARAEPEIADPALRFLLLDLHNLVVSFVENPIFHGVLDIEETKKAKSSVIEIGLVSDKIKVVAKQLRRTPGK